MFIFFNCCLVVPCPWYCFLFWFFILLTFQPNSSAVCLLLANLNIPDFASGSNFTKGMQKHTWLKKFIFGENNLDIILSLVSVAETVHLVWKKWMKKYFPCNKEFCRVYLLQKWKTVKIRGNYTNSLENTDVFKIDIQYGPKRTVHDMYVKLIIQTWRKNEMNSKRGLQIHEMYDTYLKLDINEDRHGGRRASMEPQEMFCCPRETGSTGVWWVQFQVV